MRHRAAFIETTLAMSPPIIRTVGQLEIAL
jgi:hypothetical protein